MVVTRGVNITTTTGNIGIHHPHVFHVSSGPNQSYYLKCDCKRLSPPSMGGGEGENSQVKIIKSNEAMGLINSSQDIKS